MQQIQRYFRKAGKALARFFGRVKKGSPIDIAILVCAAALVIALLVTIGVACGQYADGDPKLVNLVRELMKRR